MNYYKIYKKKKKSDYKLKEKNWGQIFWNFIKFILNLEIIKFKLNFRRQTKILLLCSCCGCSVKTKELIKKKFKISDSTKKLFHTQSKANILKKDIAIGLMMLLKDWENLVFGRFWLSCIYIEVQKKVEEL